MEKSILNKSGPALKERFYTPSLEVIHVDQKNHNSIKREKADNLIMTSVLNNYEAVIVPKGLGLKYVFKGTESYLVQGKQQILTKGKYLLVNDSLTALEVLIEESGTSSICMDIAPYIVNDVLQQLLLADEIDNCSPINEFLLSPDLLIRRAKASQYLHRALHHAFLPSQNNREEDSNMELIYEITGMLVMENIELINSFYKLNSAKRATRQELFSRLLIGKEHLDDCIFETVQMKNIASACGISEFRFYRLFRQCFGRSPYNYLLLRRISKSIELKKKGHSWEEISQDLGFTDLPAFSKTFKKITGIPPSLSKFN